MAKVERSPTKHPKQETNNNEFQEFKKKLRKLKLKVEDINIAIEELPAFVERKTKSVITKKLIDLVSRGVDKKIKDIEFLLTVKLKSKAFELTKDIATDIINTTMKNRIFYETKSIPINKLYQTGIKEMYENGWRLVFTGVLNSNKGKEDNISLWERPKLKELPPSKVSSTVKKKTKVVIGGIWGATEFFAKADDLKKVVRVPA